MPPAVPPKPHVAMVLAVLSACAVAAPGSADATFTQRDAASSVQVAFDYWRSIRPGMFRDAGRRCRHDRVRIDWRRDMGSAMASAPTGGCRDRRPTIALERRTFTRLPDYHGCAVLTHELGHLLGLRHSHSDANVMSGRRGRGARPPRQATWQRAWQRCD